MEQRITRTIQTAFLRNANVWSTITEYDPYHADGKKWKLIAQSGFDLSWWVADL